MEKFVIAFDNIDGHLEYYCVVVGVGTVTKNMAGAYTFVSKEDAIAYLEYNIDFFKSLPGTYKNSMYVCKLSTSGVTSISRVVDLSSYMKES